MKLLQTSPLVWLACWLLWSNALFGQIIIIDPHHHPRPPIVPRPIVERDPFRIQEWTVQYRIEDQLARVQMTQVVSNPRSVAAEAQILFPLPDQAMVQGLTLLIDGKELPGKLMKKEEARKIYEEIVRRDQDPALLEYAGQGSYQTNVFPIPPQGSRRVEIRYSQLLHKDQGLTELAVPLRMARFGKHPIGELTVDVQLQTSQPLKAVYSSTHQPDLQRPDERHAHCRLRQSQVTNPDDFRLFFSTSTSGIGMSLVGYRPAENDEGYFLLLADPEFAPVPPSHRIAKRMIYVLDRSGSMSGEKMEQARNALRFLLDRLQPGDVFNIIAYDSEVESFRPELQKVDDTTLKAARGFIDALHSGGSTNIDGALKAALNMIPPADMPTYVLFFTDGLPTVGEMNELKIAEHVKEANRTKARLFNFGVGYDVNSRLLDRLSREQRGQSIYVKPNENIETSVASLYSRIGDPWLADLKVRLEFSDNAIPMESAITRTYPRELSELYRGEQLVWVGRYRPSGKVTVRLSGKLGSEEKVFTQTADLPRLSTDEKWSFIAKLWATRRIGELIDQLDLLGKNQELIDELVRLSLKYGIMTPYTSFLAEEDVKLSESGRLRLEAENRASRMLREAGGQSGFAQRQFKGDLQRARTSAPVPAQADFDNHAPIAASRARSRTTSEKPRATETLRHIGTHSFFLKEGKWMDADLNETQLPQATKITQYSSEWFELARGQHGENGKYLAQEGELVLQLEGKIYHILPEKKSQ